MHNSRALTQKLIPTFATVCLLGSQARALIPRRFAPSQSGPVRHALTPTWSSGPSNVTSLLTVPFYQLPQFVGRVGTPLENTSEVLGRMRDLASQSARNTANSSQRARLDVLYQANLNLVRNITEAAHYQSIFVLDGSSDALLLGPVGSGRMLTIDLPDLTDSGIFPFGMSLIRSQQMAMDALPLLDAALNTADQTQTELNDATQTLGAPLGGQKETTSQGAAQFEVPSNLIPQFVQRTTLGLAQSGNILVAMQSLAQQNAANGTTQTERDERARVFEGLQLELDKFAYSFSIGDFVLFDGNGEAILMGSGRLNAEIDYDLPWLTTSGLFTSDPAIESQPQAQQTLASMSYALFQIQESRLDLQLAAHLAAL